MKPIVKNTKNDYIWNSIGVLSQSATSPALLVIVARFHGDEGLIIFSYLFSLSLILWAINLWGGRTYQVSDLRKEFTVTGYLMVRLLFAIMVLILALLIGIIEGFSGETILLLIFLTLFKVVEAIADTFFGVMQSNDVLFVAGKSLFYKAIIGVALFTLIDFFLRNLILATLALIIVNTFFLFFYDYRIVRKLTKYHFSRFIKYITESKTIIKRTWQMALISIIANITLNIPRIVLAQFHEPALGRFGAIALAVTATSLVMTFVIQPKILRISRQFVAKEYGHLHDSISATFLLLGGLGISAIIVTILLGVPVLTFVFGLDFAGERLALTIIVVGGLLNAVVLLFFNILIIMREMEKFLWLLVITNILLIPISIWLIAPYSILGATVAYTICTLFQSIFSFIIYRRKISKMRKEQFREIAA